MRILRIIPELALLMEEALQALRDLKAGQDILMRLIMLGAMNLRSKQQHHDVRQSGVGVLPRQRSGEPGGHFHGALHGDWALAAQEGHQSRAHFPAGVEPSAAGERRAWLSVLSWDSCSCPVG